MKLTLRLSTPLLLALAGIACADVPKKAPLSKYTGLWTNSPFTSKPVGPEQTPEEDIFKDYALIGISPISNSGYRVTLINKKNPEERKIVDSGKADPTFPFTIVGVERKPGDPLGTAVRMKSGTKTGLVRIDEKLLTLAAPKAAPVVNQPNQQPPGQPQLQPGQQPANGQRQPRPRVIPPPAPQAGQVQQPAQRPQRRGN